MSRFWDSAPSNLYLVPVHGVRNRPDTPAKFLDPNRKYAEADRARVQSLPEREGKPAARARGLLLTSWGFPRSTWVADDLPYLVGEFADRDVDARPRAWDDPDDPITDEEIMEADFILTDSVWSNWGQLKQWLRFVSRVELLSRKGGAVLLPSANDQYVGWNKQYLMRAQGNGVPVIATTGIPVGVLGESSPIERTDQEVDDLIDRMFMRRDGNYSPLLVVQPASGGGADGMGVFARTHEGKRRALAHMMRLHDTGMDAIAQPYMFEMHDGELNALFTIDGKLASVIKKKALLEQDALEEIERGIREDSSLARTIPSHISLAGREEDASGERLPHPGRELESITPELRSQLERLYVMLTETTMPVGSRRLGERLDVIRVGDGLELNEAEKAASTKSLAFVAAELARLDAEGGSVASDLVDREAWASLFSGIIDEVIEARTTPLAERVFMPFKLPKAQSLDV